MKPKYLPLFRSGSLAIFGSICFAISSHAASLTWDGNGATEPNPNGGDGTWNVNDTANWWDGATHVVWPDSGLGGTDDDAVFGKTAGTVTLGSAVTANDLTFSDFDYTITGAFTLTLNGTPPTVTTDAGISATIESVVAGVNGLTKAGDGTLSLTGVNTFTGATSVTGGTLELGGAGQLNSGAYTNTIALATGTTLKANSTAAQTLSGIISGQGSLVKTNSGTLTLSVATNTFSGGIAIKAGTVEGTVNASFGGAAGVITLGDSTGSTAATLLGSGTASHVNPILVQAGTSGTLTILGQTNSPIFFGALALENNLTVDNLTSTKTTSFTTGTWTQGGTGLITVTKGTGAGMVAITSATILASGGLAYVNDGATGGLTISGGFTGTGDIALNNNTALDDGIVISGAAINPVGALTNSGAGTGLVSIRSVIGTNVLGVVQNSATSPMFLYGANTYNGDTTVDAGTLVIAQGGTMGSISSMVTVNSGGLLVLAASSTPRLVANDMTLNGGTLQAVRGNVGTGGTITVDSRGVTHKFTSSGTLVMPIAVTADYLLVGGGGGGGTSANNPGSNQLANGGVGGARVTGSTAISATSYAVTVGGGGAAATAGGASTAFSASASGGAGGTASGGNAAGAAGTAYSAITGTSYAYGGGGGDGSVSLTVRYSGGVSGGGAGAQLSRNHAVEF